MTLEELLKAQNLTDEQVTAIIGGMKENKIFTASEENLDIRYGKLKTNHDALVAKDAESQKLIEELQKATKGQDAVQAKITEYEATITRQQEELQQAKTEAALKVGLLSEGARMIGGNTIAQLQISTSEKTEIGAGVKRWSTVLELSGFLDLSSGDSKYTTYNAKVQESSHIFICDWKPVDVSIKAENSRLLVNGSAYDVMLIDDPMGLHRQLEIYLQYRGGQ